MVGLARSVAVLMSGAVSFVAGFSIFAAQGESGGSCELPMAWQGAKASCQGPEGCSERALEAVIAAAAGGCRDVRLAEGPLRAAAHALLAATRGSDAGETWQDATGTCEAAGGTRCGAADMTRAARVAVGLGLDDDQE